ncbi:MAG TPA: AgmX/PglI C-terminal domain-containing protein [Candidatus Binatia bacterium]|nr:AgmX/PglI C-terminal domain-containing protein [Candidatus Binatia bacterium]
MNNTQDWPVSFKGIVGIASCVIGLGVVYFGYGIGTESPKKDAAAQARPVQQHSKRPVRAMNLALGNMVFFARDLGFVVKSAKDTPVDSEKIAARIENQLSNIRQLYRDELAKSPALAGSLVVQFTIAPAGEIQQIQEVSSRMADSEFRKAVLGEAAKWSFSEIVTDSVQVTCALLFVHEGMDITTLVHWEKALAESTDKPNLARATGNAAPGKAVKTAQTAPAADRPTAQRAAAKSDGKEFQIKYATSLRKEPNFSAASLVTLTIGSKVDVISRQGDWLEVRSVPVGPSGFIRKEFVTPIEVARQ